MLPAEGRADDRARLVSDVGGRELRRRKMPKPLQYLGILVIVTLVMIMVQFVMLEREEAARRQNKRRAPKTTSHFVQPRNPKRLIMPSYPHHDAHILTHCCPCPRLESQKAPPARIFLATSCPLWGARGNGAVQPGIGAILHVRALWPRRYLRPHTVGWNVGCESPVLGSSQSGLHSRHRVLDTNTHHTHTHTNTQTKGLRGHRMECLVHLWPGRPDPENAHQRGACDRGHREEARHRRRRGQHRSLRAASGNSRAHGPQLRAAAAECRAARGLGATQQPHGEGLCHEGGCGDPPPP